MIQDLVSTTLTFSSLQPNKFCKADRLKGGITLRTKKIILNITLLLVLNGPKVMGPLSTLHFSMYKYQYTLKENAFNGLMPPNITFKYPLKKIGRINGELNHVSYYLTIIGNGIYFIGQRANYKNMKIFY